MYKHAHPPTLYIKKELPKIEQKWSEFRQTLETQVHSAKTRYEELAPLILYFEN